jgi:hypothetical protein
MSLANTSRRLDNNTSRRLDNTSHTGRQGPDELVPSRYATRSGSAILT